MKALVAIRPEYAERILTGGKTYEYRRRIWRRDDVDTIVIYATAPVRAIVGEARIDAILDGTPTDIWNLTHDSAGIDRTRFMAYLHGTDTAHAIRLCDPIRYTRPRPLTDYGLTRPPRSFVYLDGRPAPPSRRPISTTGDVE